MGKVGKTIVIILIVAMVVVTVGGVIAAVAAIKRIPDLNLGDKFGEMFEGTSEKFKDLWSDFVDDLTSAFKPNKGEDPSGDLPSDWYFGDEGYAEVNGAGIYRHPGPITPTTVYDIDFLWSEALVAFENGDPIDMSKLTGQTVGVYHEMMYYIDFSGVSDPIPPGGSVGIHFSRRLESNPCAPFVRGVDNDNCFTFSPSLTSYSELLGLYYWDSEKDSPGHIDITWTAEQLPTVYPVIVAYYTNDYHGFTDKDYTKDSTAVWFVFPKYENLGA